MDMKQDNTRRGFCLLLSLLCCLIGSLPASATTDNIAPAAHLTASSALDGFPVENITDGAARVMDAREWRSASTQTFWGQIDYPELTLRWDSLQSVNRIVLYDRPTPDSHIAGVALHFSDSSRIFVNSIPNDGNPKVVDFDTKQIEWVRIEVTDADGIHVGFSEVEVFLSVDANKSWVGKVNPYIETARGRYFYFVTGSLPFGMISSAPLTRNKNQYGGGYNYNSQEVLGFPQLHDWMMSGVTLMPTTAS